jgi:acetolactate synthase-1/2/3 large subunit
MTNPGNERSMRTIPVQDGAEAFVEMLVSNGIEYLFINSGTDTFPIQEAIARMIGEERPTLDVILCIDETTAMFAAQGYYQLTGKVQAVLVHVDAGTLQIGGAYHDVQRDKAGVLVFAGRAPSTFGGTTRGGKDMPIHWIQEQRDQGGIVRNFTKWDYELRDLDSVNWVIQKAYQIATTEPAGATYVSLPRELLLQEMSELNIPPSARHGRPVSPAPDPEAIITLADWLVSADKPLIITSAAGRDPDLVSPLTALAEAIGAPVAGAIGTRLNIPTQHPLNASTCNPPSISEADVILVIDHDIPWIPGPATTEPAGRIAWIDFDPTKDNIPLWTFPADLLMHASPSAAIPALLDAVNKRLTVADQQRISGRVSQYAQATLEERERLLGRVMSVKDDTPIHPLWVAHCLEQVLEDDAIVMNEGMTGGWPWIAYTDRKIPGTVFASGGSSLGWGLGAALGAKLAHPTRDVIALEGDGSFVFARPTSAFWAAERYNAPFLTVIYNNSRHQATINSWNRFFPEGTGPQDNIYVGSEIDPSPDYHILVQACRGYGERVDTPAQVLPALRRGLERVRAGQAAVIDIRIAQMDGRMATN